MSSLHPEFISPEEYRTNMEKRVEENEIRLNALYTAYLGLKKFKGASEPQALKVPLLRVTNLEQSTTSDLHYVQFGAKSLEPQGLYDRKFPMLDALFSDPYKSIVVTDPGKNTYHLKLAYLLEPDIDDTSGHTTSTHAETSQRMSIPSSTARSRNEPH